MKINEYIQAYAQYMEKTVDEVVEYIEKLRTETYNVLSYSYGKDSGACIYACELLGIPIHEIITADVWATDDIPADLPPMWNWKAKADSIIKERYGIDVKHVCAMTTKEKKYNPNFQMPLVSVGGYKFTYQDGLYRTVQQKRAEQRDKEYEEYHKCHKADGLKYIYGFPCGQKPWCNSHLKVDVLKRLQTDLPRLVLSDIERKVGEGGVSRIPDTEVELLHKRPQTESVTTDFQYQSTEGIGVRHSKQKGF